MDSQRNSISINDIAIDVSDVQKIKDWVTELIKKDKLDIEQQTFLNEKCLRRYLVARRGDVEAVKENLLATLKWRSEHIIKPCCCLTCQEIPKAHCFIPIGWDGKGNPIMYV